MASKTQPYRNQHRELERLTASIPLDPEKIDPASSRYVIESIRSILAVHVKLQSGLLYPWMRAHVAPELREKAVMFSLVSERTLNAVQEFSDRWRTADAIAASRHAFTQSWQVISHQLRELLAAQERELYPAIEAHSLAET